MSWKVKRPEASREIEGWREKWKSGKSSEVRREGKREFSSERVRREGDSKEEEPKEKALAPSMERCRFELPIKCVEPSLSPNKRRREEDPSICPFWSREQNASFTSKQRFNPRIDASRLLHT